MPNFVEYDRSRAHDRRGDACVTIQRRGLISFSRAAIEALGRPEGIVFLVDPEERLLGFKGAAPGRAGRKAAAVRGPSNIVSATNVLRHLGADLGEARRYPLTVADGVHFIDLKEPGEVVTSSRHRGRGARRKP